MATNTEWPPRPQSPTGFCVFQAGVGGLPTIELNLSQEEYQEASAALDGLEAAEEIEDALQVVLCALLSTRATV